MEVIMEKSIKLDINKINGIIKSLTNIKKCFDQHSVNNANNLKNDEVAQAACTQFITNIYEDKKKLRDETLNKLIELNKIRLAGARNIASHDYDSLEFSVIFLICTQLTKAAVLSEAYKILSELESEEEGNQKNGGA
jgi:uncharacterized protein with HEPN domain